MSPSRQRLKSSQPARAGQVGQSAMTERLFTPRANSARRARWSALTEWACPEEAHDRFADCCPEAMVIGYAGDLYKARHGLVASPGGRCPSRLWYQTNPACDDGPLTRHVAWPAREYNMSGSSPQDWCWGQFPTSPSTGWTEEVHEHRSRKRRPSCVCDSEAPSYSSSSASMRSSTSGTLVEQRPICSCGLRRPFRLCGQQWPTRSYGRL